MKQDVSLYLRIRSASGAWIYARAAMNPNGRPKPLHAVVAGKAERHPEGIYALRYWHGTARKWEHVGIDPTLAQVALQKKTLALQIAGLAEPESDPADPAEEMSEITPDPVAVSESLFELIIRYLEEVKRHKAERTYLAYRLTLIDIAECLLTVRFERKRDDQDANEALFAPLADFSLEALTREAVMKYLGTLIDRGSSRRTANNRAVYLRTFIKWAGGSWPLRKNDMPKFTKKKVRAYNSIEIGRMFAVADREEADLLSFFLCTGVREREAQFACWTDIDFTKKTYTVTEHRDLGFTPKDCEEGEIAIPDQLVEVLSRRRDRYPRTRLVFPGPRGKSNGHTLRVVKRLALRAGVNCGHCINKAGKSCVDQPVCSHVLLHKMRKTFATFLHEHGASARTIMGLLRHSDIQVTLRYLAGQDDATTRTISAAAFGSIVAGGAQ